MYHLCLGTYYYYCVVHVDSEAYHVIIIPSSTYDKTLTMWTSQLAPATEPLFNSISASQMKTSASIKVYVNEHYSDNKTTSWHLMIL